MTSGFLLKRLWHILEGMSQNCWYWRRLKFILFPK